jgi:serine/threonine protein phosphatase 1
VYELCKRFELNRNGRDFVVGDIHGCFDELEEALKAVSFDKRWDRLFSVGDLIDRGPQSESAVYYVMQERWFHAIKGNHEQMLIDALNPDYPNAAGNHAQNGGMWFYGLPTVEQQCIALVFDDLPLAMEVETDQGVIGIIHAEVPNCNWHQFKTLYPFNKEHFDAVAMWARTRIARGTTRQVIGIDHVYVGHSCVDNPLTLGNVTYVDTGAGFKEGRITLIQIQ